MIQNKYAYNGKRYIKLPREQWIIIENTHPAIISKEQFADVAPLARKSALKYKNKDKSTASENRYLGKVFCSRCGKIAVRRENRQSDRITFYYSCRYCINELKYKNGLKSASHLPVDKLDIIVMETLGKCMDMLPQFENLAERLPKSDLFKRKRAKIIRDRTDCEKTICDYEELFVAAYTHHLSGLLDIREYKLIRDKVMSDKSDSESQLVQIIREQAKYDIHQINNNLWLLKYGEFRDCKAPTKEMVQTLIGCIYLTPLSNEINIELNYMDSFEELRQLIQECEVDC